MEKRVNPEETCMVHSFEVMEWYQMNTIHTVILADLLTPQAIDKTLAVFLSWIIIEQVEYANLTSSTCVQSNTLEKSVRRDRHLFYSPS